MGFEWIPLKNYKRHYLCLGCQKGFKRSSQHDMKHPESSDLSNLMTEYYTAHREADVLAFIQASFQQLKAACPQCRKPMVQVSYDFEVPWRRDEKTWKGLRKRFHHTTVISYDTYIHWHRLQLQEATADQAMRDILQYNLTKLEEVNG